MEAAPSITLQTPIVRGETKIEALTLRKPNAGELRGLQLQALMQGDVNNVLGLLPRITLPPITGPEAEALDPSDLAAVTGTVQNFFMTPLERQAIARAMGMAEPEKSSD